MPPRVIASRLSVNSGETVHLVQVFSLSVAVERTGTIIRVGLGQGALPPAKLGPPCHCHQATA